MRWRRTVLGRSQVYRFRPADPKAVCAHVPAEPQAWANTESRVVREIPDLHTIAAGSARCATLW